MVCHQARAFLRLQARAEGNLGVLLTKRDHVAEDGPTFVATDRSDEEQIGCQTVPFRHEAADSVELGPVVPHQGGVVWAGQKFTRLLLLAPAELRPSIAHFRLTQPCSGSPGVGKTLTVEGLSEYLKRPLYAISAGELGQDPKTLEEQLTTIFRLAHHWKAILLLDEADVFVQSRSFVNQHNALVSVFLRTLEYYLGIMFLTTNRIKDIDDAIQSRISVALHYGSLGLATRTTIWESFLQKVAATKGGVEYTTADLEWLSEKKVNGRQIKNMITTAHALALEEMVPLTRSHLELVIELDKEFQKDYVGAGQIANEASYF